MKLENFSLLNVKLHVKLGIKMETIVTVAGKMKVNIRRKKYQCNSIENFLELEKMKGGEESNGLSPSPFFFTHHTDGTMKDAGLNCMGWMN